MNPTLITGKSINEVVYKSLDKQISEGYRTKSRNGDISTIYNAFVTLDNPKARHLALEGRKNNIFATIAETFWVFAGSNNIDPYLSFFLPRAKDFSDDGVTWRGGYPERIITNNQIDDVLEQFRNEGIYTRRAVLVISDPHLDTVEGLAKVGLETTKDRPCFLPETEIFTNSGYKRIDEVNENDLVYSYNEENECMELKEVIWSGKTATVEKYLKITLSDGSVVKVTEDHPMYMKKYSYKGRVRQPYVQYMEDSKNVKLGDYILSSPIHEERNEIKYKLRETSETFIKVEKIEVIDEIVDVFDITVADNHNFILKSGGWIVHNCNLIMDFFITPNKKLHMNVKSRSGDVIWGFGSINIFEWTFLQEMILQYIQDEIDPQVTLGTYNHHVTNLHLYDFSGSQGYSVIENKLSQKLGLNADDEIEFPVIEDIHDFFTEIVNVLSEFIVGDIDKQEATGKINQHFNDHRVSKTGNILYEYVLILLTYIQQKKFKGDETFVPEILTITGSDEFYNSIDYAPFRKFPIQRSEDGNF